MKLGLGLLLFWATTAAHAAASNGGIDVSGAYVSDARAYNNGQRGQADFRYHGSRAGVMLHVPLQYGNAKGTLGPYAQQQVLTNNFTEETAAGEKATETLTMTGAGLAGVLVSELTGNLQISLAVGVSRVEIEQTGDTPKTQTYPYAAEGKLGVGVGPMLGASGFFLRAEYQMMALWNGKTTSGEGEGEKLRNVWVENWAPVLGFMLGF